MRRTSRQHPVQTFRFWFLVLAGVCAATAWKFGLLPVHQHNEQVADTETALTPFDDESSEPPEPDPAAIDALMQAQTEPPLAGLEAPEPGAGAPFPAENHPGREIPRVSRVDENPFGNARPEFTAVDGVGVNSNAGVHGDIVLLGNEEPQSPAAQSPPPQSLIPQSPPPRSAFQTSSIPQSPPPQSQIQPSPMPQSPAAVVPPQPNSAPVDLTEVKALLAQGTTDAEVEAHRLLSEMYWSNPAARPQLIEDLEATARRIYFLPQPNYMNPYTVQPGDNLQTIAEQYDITWQYLARLNRITDARRLQAGQKLKVIRGPFSAVVDLSDYQLTVHAHGYFVFRFPVGIGKDGSSPEGTFIVEEKLIDPTYYGPDGVIEHDDPSNPLGERWIGIGSGYGIHGTIDPDSIGRNESRGCIRMHNRDVEIVYDLLTVGSEVVIQR